jgi:GTP-binding protein HflX
MDRRRVRDRIARLQKEIQSIRRKRGERRKMRVSRGLPIVTLVGYTNAGKSSLLNRLTESSVAAGSRMFETLDPTSRRLRVPVEREVLLADTVGFIRDLPPELLEAFRATLEEIETSSLILHVVDASQPDYPERMATVVGILEGLEFGDIPRLVVYNKADLVSPEARTELGSGDDHVLVSAVTGEGTEPLVARIGALLKESGKPYEAVSSR